MSKDDIKNAILRKLSEGTERDVQGAVHMLLGRKMKLVDIHYQFHELIEEMGRELDKLNDTQIHSMYEELVAQEIIFA